MPATWARVYGPVGNKQCHWLELYEIRNGDSAQINLKYKVRAGLGAFKLDAYLILTKTIILNLYFFNYFLAHASLD